MEALPGGPRSVSDGTIPEERRLESGAGKVERVVQHSKGLVDDLTTWVDLKIKLTQAEIEEKIESKVRNVILQAAPFVVGALAGLFLLVAIAHGLGWWLGHPFWGFMLVTALLMAVAGGLKAAARRTGGGNK